MITENLSTLKIHQLSKDQYKREFEDGRIDENAFYLTPDAGHMVVTIANGKASHSAIEINNHVQAGGTVVAQHGGEHYYLNHLDTSKAQFTTVQDDAFLYGCMINDDNTVQWINIELAKGENIIRFTPQTLTEEQKAQARENIGVTGTGVDGEVATVDYVDERIGAIVVPTKISQLENDSKYLTSVPSEYVTDTEMQNYAQPKGNYLTTIPSEYITESELNAKKYLTSYTETDPTVPAWAKAASKPSYSKSEVGLGNVDNVKQYSTENPPVVCQTTAPEDTSVIWVDTDDNSVDEFQEAVNTALAQAKASGEFNGKDGTNGKDGQNGVSATHSWNGTTLTITSASGTSSANLKGEKGGKGDTGAAGKTPVKGVDYWTEADQESIIQQILTELGAIPVFGRVDENNNIILTAVLADGTYQLKYADADGNVTDICTYNHSYAPAPDVPDVPTPTYTNVLPLAKGEDGSPYNGTGYAVGKRINSSWNETNVSTPTATNPVFLTGRIPIPAGATVRFKNCYIDTNGVNGVMNNAADEAYYGHGLSGLYGCMLYYNPTSGTGIKAGTNYTWNNFVSYSNLASAPTVDSNGYVTEFTFNTTETLYARFVLGGDPTTAIITINEPITG